MDEELDVGLEGEEEAGEPGTDTAWLEAWHAERRATRCLGKRRVSGRYQGYRDGPALPLHALDLRVDIDRRYSASSPVMDRVSGDVYSRRALPSGRTKSPIAGAVYRHSWIIDAPTVKRGRCSVTITGSVRYWSGGFRPTKAKIVITWTGTGLRAVASFTGGFLAQSYTCDYVSDAFRSMTMEVDVCDSANTAPTLPSYATHALADRPADTPSRTLTLPVSYREAGVAVTMAAGNTVDDSAASFSTWSVAELHDAMETHFSQVGASWPRWNMWGLLAGRFTSAGTAGIMFDAAAAYGGAGEAPDRQGYAVFRQHSWFNDLVAAPSTAAQWEAARTFLYTYVHEAGHAFNFLHSWNKGRPNSRSWMNYPHNITDFYDTFYFRFDDEELIHMRHGDRRSVIMGGDDWASGGHLDDDASMHLMGADDPEAPLEVLLRSKEYFDFLEPVAVEVRVRNLLPDTSQLVDARFGPEHGVIAFTIQRPNGHVSGFHSLFCAVGEPAWRELKGREAGKVGEDRHSQLVPLSFGTHGFAFDEPGEYRVRCYHVDADGFVTPSNTHRIRVGRPVSREEDRLAQDYYTRDTGLVLALGDHRSPLLEKGANAVREVLARRKGTPAAARLGTLVAQAHLRPFHRVATTRGKLALKLAEKAQEKRALQLSEDALKLARADTSKAGNLVYREVVELRATALRESGQGRQATKEVATLKADLARRGVHPVNLQGLK